MAIFQEKLKMNKNGAGFTLLEVMAAVFVVTVGLIGIFIVIQNLSTYTAYSKDRLVASYLAQEGMEIIRNIRDTNWLERQNPEKQDNLWDEGFGDCLNGCEADYFCTTVEEPSVTNPVGHLCLTSYSGSNLKIDNDGFYNYASGVDTKFTRKITVTPDDIDTLTVKVSVSYPKGTVEVLEKLYNWQEE